VFPGFRALPRLHVRRLTIIICAILAIIRHKFSLRYDVCRRMEFREAGLTRVQIPDRLQLGQSLH